MPLTPLIIALAGPTGSGKTSIVNSLVGNRILQSGLQRTTKEPVLIGPFNSFNDRRVKFLKQQLANQSGREYCLLDLPGVNRPHEDGDFSSHTRSCVVNCNVILWVSSIHNAFVEPYEKAEFDKLIKICEANTRETGALYEFAIVLSKYNFNDEVQDATTTQSLDENGDDTTLADLYQRVVTMYPNMQIIKFNAFARIKFQCDKSTKFDRLIQGGEHIVQIHTEWPIDTFFDRAEKRFQQELNCLNYLLSKIEHDPHCEARVPQANEYFCMPSCDVLTTTAVFSSLCERLNQLLYINRASQEKMKQLFTPIVNFITRHKFDIVCVFLCTCIEFRDYSYIAHVQTLPRDDALDAYANFAWECYYELCVCADDMAYPIIDATSVVARTVPQKYVVRHYTINELRRWLNNMMFTHEHTYLFSVESDDNGVHYMRTTFNSIFRFDLELFEHPSRAMSKKWQDEVRKERARLYEGDDADINTAIALIYQKKIKSVMQRID